VASVATGMQGDVSYVEKCVRTEVKRAMSQVQVELEGHMDSLLAGKAQTMKSALVQFFTETQSSLLSEVTARMDASRTTLEKCVSTFEAEIIENLELLSTTLVDVGRDLGKDYQIVKGEVDAALSNFDIKLTDIEASVLELVGDEALERRSLPFFQAHQLEARDGLSQLQPRK